MYNNLHLEGHKRYEISNHLGNVMAVITDRKRGFKIPASGIQYAYYRPAVLTATDYYAFGMEMPGRTYSASTYRYGFNGKENDRSNFGLQLVQDYGMRLYNPALGKFLSVDPIAKQYPELTPYQFASNTPIMAIDLDGLEAASVSKLDFGGKTVILSVNTGGMINKSATNFDAAGLSPVGMQRNSAIVTQKAAVAQARAKAGRSEFKADLRSDYQRSQSIQTLQQMEIQKGINGRCELDPVAGIVGGQLADPKTWVATVSVVAPQIIASALPAIPSIAITNSIGISAESIAGASSDVVAQMSNNMIQGKSFSESLGEVNIVNTAAELLFQGKLAPAASGVLGSFISFKGNKRDEIEFETDLGKGLRNSAISVTGNYIGESFNFFKIPNTKLWRAGTAFGTNLVGDNTANAAQNAFDKNKKP